MSWTPRLTALAMGGLPASAAVACPFCESPTGQQVRAGIFNVDFVDHLFLTLLPFPILLAIVALIYFGPPWRWRAGRGAVPTHLRLLERQSSSMLHATDRSSTACQLTGEQP